MRRYLIDSGPLAAYLNGRPAAVHLVSPWIATREVVTSVVVYGEIIEYFKSLPRFVERRSELRRVLQAVYPYFPTYAILEQYADIRRSMRRPYGPGLIGDIDTLIAATAREYDLTLVTMDSDFERVPGLKTMIISIRS